MVANEFEGGRRASVIRGGSIISAAMLLIGVMYASGASDTSAGKWVVVALIYVFIISFAFTWAVAIRTYCAGALLLFRKAFDLT